VAVDAWTFESTPPGEGAAYDDPSPWGAFLREVIAPSASRVSLSPAMRCAADEIARFVLKHGALPTESLRRFTVARCGAVSSTATPLYWSVTAPASVRDEEVIAHARGHLGEMIGKTIAQGYRVIGLAAVRDADRIVVAAVTGTDDVRLEPGSRTLDASRRVTLRGTVRGEVASLSAMINQGDALAKHCEPDARVAPPRFAITCSLAEGDKSAWIELLARKPGRLLISDVADLLVYEGDPSALTYKVQTSGAAAPVNAPADFTRALLDRLNGVRSRAKLPPLVLAPKQSAENTRLAGTLVDASHANDDAIADRIAIGLLAGWNVDGLIRAGNFFSLEVAPTKDATAWLDFALERPLGRSVLLDPDVRKIAIGPAIPDGVPALSAAVTTYALFESRDHSADEKRVLAKISAMRALHGAPAAVRVGGLDELAQEAALVQSKGKPPAEALQNVLDAAAQRTGGGVRGLVLETSDLDELPLPPELLAPGPLRIALAVTHHRAEGAAWGQYVVFIVVSPVAAASPTQQASRGAPSTL
jgi:hypothetical protein